MSRPISLFVEEAKQLGFIAVGFCHPERPVFYENFTRWIAQRKNGEMAWLARNMDLRENPRKLLEGCQTVISLAFPHSPVKPRTPEGYTIARYTEPRKTDYHDRLRKQVRPLLRQIARHDSGSRTRVCIDSAPILERSFAYVSGIGFIGKNNMVIVPGHGSYLFLAEILTTASFEFRTAEPLKSQCGSCTRCIEVCPTGSLAAPFLMDASKCLSYLTIEYQGTLNHQISKKMGNCFFGCDLCQEVCPFNRDRFATETSLPPLANILEMKEEGFKDKFGKTSLARAGLAKIKNNIEVITGGFKPGSTEAALSTD